MYLTITFYPPHLSLVLRKVSCRTYRGRMFHPNSNNALVIKTGGELSFEQRPSQIPKPRANEALVRVSHVAQNSIDSKIPSRSETVTLLLLMTV